MNTGYLLTRTAEAYPDRVAIRHGDYQLSYGELNSRVNQLAHSLSRIGVGRGDRVCIFMPNRPEILECLLACFKAGVVAVPVNFRLHPNELAYIVEHSEAKAVFSARPLLDNVMKAVSQVSHKPVLVAARDPGAAGNGWLDYEDLLAGQDTRELLVDVRGTDVGWLFYTSGTTGRPKGVMINHRMLNLMVLNVYADVYPFSRHDRALHAAPLTHGSGLYALPLLAKGGLNIIYKGERFLPEEVFRIIEAERITVLPFLAPTMLKRLLEADCWGRYDLSSLKCIIYGGGPMYVEDLKEAIRRFGKILVQIYGQGECPMTITALDAEDHDENDEEILASAGIPRLGVQVNIVDEQGNEVPRGQMGEIVAYGDLVMEGYWRDPKATQETVQNGWLRTGDLGYMNERGYVFIMDRSKDMIISGGNNIYPREVEEVILRHPAVAEVCVFGVPDAEWGEAVKAVVVKKPGAEVTAEEIIAFCKDNLASYKKPKLVDFIDELPKSAYGKVLKRELRDRYWTGYQRKV
jgi:acyl-CoA synthetase (AMP-forming)/AMP-acid ligase II